MVYRYIPLDRYRAGVRQRAATLPMAAVMPNSPAEWWSLAQYAPTPYNQGNLGSCTANAICALLKMINPDRTFDPSRLWIYTQELLMENPGQPLADRGANAADGCTIVNRLGVCREELMPYTMDAALNVLDFGQMPSAAAIADAAEHKFGLFQNATLEPLLGTIRALISQDIAVMMAFLVYPSFETAEDGIIPMPSAAELAAGPIGGHMVLILGYGADRLQVLNSWGATWGQAGLFQLPNAYLEAVAPNGERLVSQLLIMGPVVRRPWN